MANRQMGKQSIRFENPPIISGAASVVGEKEGQGPYGEYFDVIEKDPKVGADSWEEAEGKLQEKAAMLAIRHAKLTKKDIRYMVAGDLLGQLMASSFGLISMDIPLFGIYGACSTMGESLGIAAMIVDGGFAEHAIAITSSHFASAEKQFRFPLGYGNQRPKAATWTVTGSGAVVLTKSVRKEEMQQKGEWEEISKRAKEEKGKVKVKGITTGKIVDYGVKDSMNMGACMAPAAGEVIVQNFIDFGYQPEHYDKIITGDLGKVGKDIVIDYVKAKGYDITKQYMDCGIEIYGEEQNTQAGGSGCGCSAVMLAGYILKQLENGDWKRVLFVPTGALLSQVSFNEGNSVPGIAHGVILEKM
ncbi:MAG: stage V sporulation protein AD [Butyribacter sp.]|nr:stage V sporulation protein AD [bacterium]MDY3853795.1 stage V sporulation protein AD [Butyribacter sp.]